MTSESHTHLCPTCPEKPKLNYVGVMIPHDESRTNRSVFDCPQCGTLHYKERPRNTPTASRYGYKNHARRLEMYNRHQFVLAFISRNLNEVSLEFRVHEMDSRDYRSKKVRLSGGAAKRLAQELSQFANEEIEDGRLCRCCGEPACHEGKYEICWDCYQEIYSGKVYHTPVPDPNPAARSVNQRAKLHKTS